MYTLILNAPGTQLQVNSRVRYGFGRISFKKLCITTLTCLKTKVFLIVGAITCPYLTTMGQNSQYQCVEHLHYHTYREILILAYVSPNTQQDPFSLISGYGYPSRKSDGGEVLHRGIRDFRTDYSYRFIDIPLHRSAEPDL